MKHTRLLVIGTDLLLCVLTIILFSLKSLSMILPVFALEIVYFLLQRHGIIKVGSDKHDFLFWALISASILLGALIYASFAFTALEAAAVIMCLIIHACMLLLAAQITKRKA